MESETFLDECILSTALKLKNFYIDDDAEEELENEIFETEPQKRSKAQTKALRKRRESAAIFNRLSEDTSANFLNDNIDFARTFFFDDGIDYDLTNASTETAKNNTDIDKTPNLRKNESTANVQKLYEALRLPRNAADETILSENKTNSHEACNNNKSVNTSNSNEHRPLYEVTNKVNYDKSNTLSNRSIQDETSYVNTATEQLQNAMNSLAHFKEIVSKFNVPSQLQMNASCSTPTPKMEHKKARTSNLRQPTFSSRLKPPVQRRLTSTETVRHTTNNYSEDNKYASNLSNSKLLRTPSARPKK